MEGLAREGLSNTWLG